MKDVHPTPEDLQKAWDELKQVHKTCLKKYGVNIPDAKRFTETNKSIYLSVLYYHKDDKPIHKNYISQIVNREKPESATDQQVRHLKRDGWDIGVLPGNHKLNPYKPIEGWENRIKNRRAMLSDDDWDGLKKEYQFSCATCGGREGEKQRFHLDSGVIILHKGHMDPMGPGNDLNNIIPQCQFCNQSYKNHFVFNEKGRVKSVASEEPVKRANRCIQRKIWEYLKEIFNSIF
ncbi:MAG: hypothetical protein OXC03_07955 [Flavobacteriaceae bacterium]|nr:hypothetical protein [Flavobacteriaceae bacterium]